MASTTDFELVPVNGRLKFTDATWDKALVHLLEFQPAKRVVLVGEPPSAIRVTAYGDGCVPEIAPAILARLSELAGVELRLVAPPGP
ncbi:hypothetical protein [Cellulomonas soli]|uniref:Uncharacterized protein n=1 Tax=Cellulomonas soli TaxID=931535 RepID=A0A512PAT3_9CELL|nr:hypothetical protein [Cellulomonas soli]NYI57398.1 hypothetical protein [Cellulomonas soli]GEP68321.1 hypothetical protein CSO01_10360 [Cellulomonas soli]